MIHIRANVKIADFAQFIGVFSTRGAALRRQHGSKRAHLFRVSGSENEIVIHFEWESREGFERFLSDPVVKETMKSAGFLAPPAVTYLEHVGDFPS